MRILWATVVLPSIAAFSICLIFLPGKSEGNPAFYPGDSGTYNNENEYDKLATLVRLVEKAKAQPRQIRYVNSELCGDLRLRYVRMR